MTYEEYLKIVLDKINSSIETKDKKLREKIYSSILKWYKKNYEEQVQNALSNYEEYKLLQISNEINRVCEENDINKLKLTYEDKNYEELGEISREIFKIIKTSIDDKNYKIDLATIQKYINRLIEIKDKISPLFKSEVEFHISEINLDINYINRKGNVNAYSVRTGRYLRSINK